MNEAISFTDDDPNAWERDFPDIQNCILWFNNNDGDQMAGCAGTQIVACSTPRIVPDGTGDYTVWMPTAISVTAIPGSPTSHRPDPNVGNERTSRLRLPVYRMGSEFVINIHGPIRHRWQDRVVRGYMSTSRCGMRSFLWTMTY